MIYNNAIELIGNTPILKVNKLVKDNEANMFIKLEKFNSTGSIKDRAVLGIIEKEEALGNLKAGATIVEATSGNTGISLSMIASIKGYRAIIAMPENMSKERINMMKAYGAEVILTPMDQGMKGAIAKAEELAKENGYFFLKQFENSGNYEKHYQTTAVEIINDMPDVNVVVIGVGTGGTISGIGKKLKEYNKNITIVAVEPETSAVLSGDAAGKHKIQGIGAGFIPKNYLGDFVDEIIKVSSEDAYKNAVEFSKKEGILVGISTGAAITGGLQKVRELAADKKVLVISPDGGEKYFSTGLFD
ncbi:MAG: cysteine synthase A [Sarcina sp.]